MEQSCSQLKMDGVRSAEHVKTLKVGMKRKSHQLMREVVLDIVIVLGFLRKTEPIRYVCMNIYICLYTYMDT